MRDGNGPSPWTSASSQTSTLRRLKSRPTRTAFIFSILPTHRRFREGRPCRCGNDRGRRLRTRALRHCAARRVAHAGSPHPESVLGLRVASAGRTTTPEENWRREALLLTGPPTTDKAPTSV